MAVLRAAVVPWRKETTTISFATVALIHDGRSTKMLSSNSHWGRSPVPTESWPKRIAGKSTAAEARNAKRNLGIV